MKFSCGSAGYECLLQQKLANINFRSGILDGVLKLLEIKASTVNEKEKICTFVLNEMSIRSSDKYDTMHKEFIENVTLGDHSGVNHAQVLICWHSCHSDKSNVLLITSEGFLSW